MATESVKFLANLQLFGNLSFGENLVDFPTDAALGTIIFKDNNFYAYIKIGTINMWYPFGNKQNSYVHVQGIPASTWTVEHNLGTENVWFMVKRDDGVFVLPAAEVIDANTLQIKFGGQAVAGVALVVSPDDINVPQIKTSVIEVAGGVVQIDSTGIRLNGEYLTVGGGAGGSTVIVDNLTSTSSISALSAAQGKILKDLIDAIPAGSSVAVVNDLTTGGTTAALSAAQGVALKALIDAIVQVSVIDDLTSDSSTAALSAAQGKALKALIDSVPGNVVVDSLTSTETGKALSAAKGKILNDLITALAATVADKQAALGFTPLNKAGDAMTGGLKNAVVNLGSISGSVNIDLGAGDMFVGTVIGTTTFNFINAPSTNQGQVAILRLTNAGSYTVNFPAGSKFAGGGVTFTASGTDLAIVYYDAINSAYSVAVVKDIR